MHQETKPPPPTATKDAAFPVTIADDQTAHDTLSDMIATLPSHMAGIARLSWQQSLGFLVTCLQTTALFFTVGTYGGDDAINGVGMGISIFFVFSHSVNFGFVTAIDTLVSQEYGRNPSSKHMGRTLKATLLVITVASMGTAAFHCFVTPVLLKRMFAEKLASDVTRFVSAAPFYPMCYAAMIAIGKFAMNQQRAQIPSVGAILTAVLSLPIFYVVLSNVERDFVIEAAGIAFSLVYVVSIVILLFLVHRDPQTSVTLGGATMDFTFSGDVVPVLRVGVPSIPLVGGEAAVFNVVNLLAGLLTPAETEAFLIRGNIGDMGFALVFGIACGTTALVGNALGAAEPRESRRYTFAGLVFTAMVATFNATMFATFRVQLYGLYTSDPDTMAAAKRLMPAFVVFHYGDMLQFVAMMCYCAVGMNRLGAVLSASVLWGLGLPTLYVVVAVLHGDVFWFTLSWASTLLLLLVTYIVVLVKFISYNDLSLEAATSPTRCDTH